MAVVDFFDWMDDFTRPEAVWYVKRLSANDTLATHAHQAGPYIRRDFLFNMFPSLNRPEAENPDVRFDLYIDSHADHRNVRAIWYNNRLRGGTRDEARLTNLGGASSALLDPESTGALAIFAFVRDEAGDAKEAHVWVCRTEAEEELAEDRMGRPIEPGHPLAWSSVDDTSLTFFERRPGTATDCRLAPEQIPPEWLESFPTGEAIIRKAVAMRPDTALDPDERLLRRRDCEFEIFQSVEEAVNLPAIKAGFSNIKEFMTLAQRILQRRKARSGRSLELHTREIFIEEGLRENEEFAYGVESEPGRRPDFLFPSRALYGDPDYPADRLRMLAVKTTCRDRWRQILNEADRISTKHLLTLQRGVSVGQFREMRDSGVRLVVPSGLKSAYPKEVQPGLMTLESFIADARLLSVR